MRFQLLAGRHAELDPTDPKKRRSILYAAPILGQGGRVIVPEDARKLHGDVIETDVDLCAKFNRPGSEKFRRLPDAPDTAVANAARAGFEGKPLPSDDNLESMTVQQLKDLALSEDIELGDATRKDQIVQAIRAGR